MWQLTDDVLPQCVLPEGKSEKLYFDRDLPGFGVRVRQDASGRVRRNWFYQYRSRLDGSQRRVKLGAVDRPGPTVSASKARQAAAALAERVHTGRDPQTERKQAKKDRKRLLLDEALKYLDDRRTGIVGKRPMRVSTYKQAKRHFELHWAALAKRPVASITEAEIKAELRRIIERHGKQGARVAKANLSAFFVWALREGIAKTNPTIATHALAQNAPRDRVFSDDEIRAIWAACRDDDCGRIIKLLLFTGCRRNEIGGLKWSELDLEAGLLVLPSHRVKSNRPLRLTLPPQAVEVLRQCPHKAGRDFVFGESGGAFGRWGVEKVRIDRRLAEAGYKLAPWAFHDCRRTVRTRLARIGIAPHIAELVLGHAAHKASRVAAAYDHYSYDREIKDALAQWANALTAIVNPPAGNVTAMRRSA